MPVGDCQRAFAASAAADGIELTSQRFPWLCQRGHFALDEESDARTLLAAIYGRLGGDPDVLAGGRSTSLTGDFLHESTGTLIEIDESQHFTSARLTTLDLYPDALALGFDRDRYRQLCRQHRAHSDRYRATKEARGFGGVGGRTRQRAYYDALRDVATPAMGHAPLVRVDAPHGDGHAAYKAHRARLHALLRPS